MPISSLIKAGTVSEDQLAPHLRTRGGATVVSVQSQTGAEAPPFIIAKASRAFKAGQAVHLSNGVFTLAMPTINNLATAIIAFDCEAEEMVKAKLSGEILTSYVHGFANGTNLYLIKKDSASTDFNLSNKLTSNDIVNGQFVQYIGIAGDKQSIYVNIGQASMISI